MTQLKPSTVKVLITSFYEGIDCLYELSVVLSWEMNRCFVLLFTLELRKFHTGMSIALLDVRSHCRGC